MARSSDNGVVIIEPTKGATMIYTVFIRLSDGDGYEQVVQAPTRKDAVWKALAEALTESDADAVEMIEVMEGQ